MSPSSIHGKEAGCETQPAAKDSDNGKPFPKKRPTFLSSSILLSFSSFDEIDESTTDEHHLRCLVAVGLLGEIGFGIYNYKTNLNREKDEQTASVIQQFKEGKEQ